MAIDPIRDATANEPSMHVASAGLPSATLAPLGWDAGWAVTFEPYAAEGHRPARVVAVHREVSIVRDETGDHAATVTGAFRWSRPTIRRPS